MADSEWLTPMQLSALSSSERAVYVARQLEQLRENDSEDEHEINAISPEDADADITISAEESDREEIQLPEYSGEEEETDSDDEVELPGASNVVTYKAVDGTIWEREQNMQRRTLSHNILRNSACEAVLGRSVSVVPADVPVHEERDSSGRIKHKGNCYF